MPGKEWIPEVVGGKDYEDGRPLPRKDKYVSFYEKTQQKVKARKAASKAASEPVGGPSKAVQKYIDNNMDDARTITSRDLSGYASKLSPNLIVSWSYGPIMTYDHGGRKQEGQYVVELRSGKPHRLFWVEG